jgi:hypothetical protein
MASFKGQALFRTWLYRVTINRVLLHFRKHRFGTLPLDDQTLPVMKTALLKNSAQTDLDNCISLRDAVAGLHHANGGSLCFMIWRDSATATSRGYSALRPVQAVHNSAKPGPRSVLLRRQPCPFQPKPCACFETGVKNVSKSSPARRVRTIDSPQLPAYAFIHQPCETCCCHPTA